MIVSSPWSEHGPGPHPTNCNVQPVSSAQGAKAAPIAPSRPLKTFSLIPAPTWELAFSSSFFRISSSFLRRI